MLGLGKEQPALDEHAGDMREHRKAKRRGRGRRHQQHDDRQHTAEAEGEDTQLVGMLARHDKAHLVLQIVLFGMRRHQRLYSAQMAEAGRRFNAARMPCHATKAPPGELHAPGRQHQHDAGLRQRRGDRQAQKRQHRQCRQQTAGGGEHQIADRGQRVVPACHRLQRGIDHRGRINRQIDQHEQQQIGPDRHDGAAVSGGKPAGKTGHDDHRQHAFARQPARPPLAERAPGPLRMAEMEGRADQSGPDQRQRDHADTDDGLLRHQRQQPDNNPAGKAEAQARHGGEEDDGPGWPHDNIPVISARFFATFLL